ncbi:odorant binding protein 6 isoform X1 [Temnothorax longispinosus]|uniref:odorant binding protein 6 isoform X1 n=1 Tax=Temnothorax longispinosus TaxID=300112 RepID=UPI003A990686
MQRIRMKATGTIFFISCVVMANLQNAESKKLSFDEIREALQPVKKHCLDRVGTDPKLPDNAVKGNFVSDRKLQCYYKCMMLNTKVMKNDKIIEKALSKIAEHMLQEDSVSLILKAMEKCHSIAMKSMDGCQLAYDYTKCIYDYNSMKLIQGSI